MRGRYEVGYEPKYQAMYQPEGRVWRAALNDDTMPDTMVDDQLSVFGEVSLVFIPDPLNRHAHAHFLRIDNGGLEYMCTWYCVFSDILAVHQSIWTKYISQFPQNGYED